MIRPLSVVPEEPVNEFVVERGDMIMEMGQREVRGRMYKRMYKKDVSNKHGELRENARGFRAGRSFPQRG